MTPSTQATGLFALLSRALIALLFIPSGFGMITGFDRAVRYISSAQVPLPELAAVIAIVVELGLGILLLVGYQTRWVALAMALFTVVLPFIFHAYWNVPAPQVMAQRSNFYKDLAIAGGLLSIATWGAGAWSIDGMRERAPAGGAVPVA